VGFKINGNVLKSTLKYNTLVQFRQLLKTMPQLSKLIRSRDDWRAKAVQRADEIREHRKTNKRHQEQIADIKRQLTALQQIAEDNKKNT